jgi:hypothetical protein
MHWLVWAAIICLVFLITYNPRTGRLGKFFAPEVSVEDGKSEGTTQSNSNSSESPE